MSSTSTSPPRKRIREGPISPLPPTPPSGTSSGKPRQKRAPTACNSCRTRKTKCDGAKPVCGSCQKLRVACEGLSTTDGEGARELTFYEQTSVKILEGIDRLESLLAVEAQSPALSHRSVRSNTTATATVPAVAQAHALIVDGIQDNAQGSSVVFSGVKAGMLDRALGWEVFGAGEQRPRIRFSGGEGRRRGRREPAVLDGDTVRRLYLRYLERVHVQYPVIDGERLGAAVERFNEGWDTEACLVLMVCALGAVSDDYITYLRLDMETEFYEAEMTERVEVAEGYWNLAQMRLGLVMAEVSELAVQCLCLVGIWYLYQFDCLAAYKFFHCACVTWPLIDLSSTLPDITPNLDTATTYTQYLAQRLYWTCLKAVCELRAELSLPVPTGSQLEYPLHFPSPPLNPPNPHDDRSWYFYTAEIFLRRLHNRLVDEVSSFETDLDDPLTSEQALNEKRIQELITVTREFEEYVSNWHSSLPGAIRFPLDGATPLDDQRQQFIRKRWLECQVLLYRPYANLVINHGAVLRFMVAKQGGFWWADVQRFAALAVRFAVVDMCADRGVWWCLVPSVWVDCRARTGEILMVRAAVEKGVEMPGGWQEVVEAAERSIVRWSLWAKKGGLRDCVDVLEWAKKVLRESRLDLSNREMYRTN